MDNKYINDPNIARTSQKIIQILKDFGLFDWFCHDESIYIGGSMLSYILSHESTNPSTLIINKNETPHDIDIYTTNHVNTIRFFNEHKKDFDVISTSGCIINFTHKEQKNKLHAQLITSEVDDFYSDVLGNYDCDLVCIGYHSASNNVIIHKRLRNAITSRKFKCYKYLSSENRSEKLEYRIKTWYDSEIEYIGEEFGRFDAYYEDCEHSQPMQTFITSVPPKYIQLFYNLYKCIGCNKQNNLLLCEECRDRMQLVNHDLDTNVNVTILGGINGFGKIIGDTYDLFANKVIRTSRDPVCTYDFILGYNASDKLMQYMTRSDIIVMNATKTLDGDESVWNTTLSTFDENLLDDRIETNVYGYTKLLNQICQCRIKQLENNEKLKRIVIVYTDANESKFNGKMVDCKHLELNIAKAGVKQIFYTNAYLFAKLNMLVMCYDPGWLSYHGISIEKKKARSSTLIPPNISANGIIFFANKLLVDFEQFMKQKQVIVDYSVYNYIDHLLKI